MGTTNDEQTQAQRDQSAAISGQGVNKKDVVNAYISGKNYYDLADQFFGFTNEEAVARIRDIVEAEIDQD